MPAETGAQALARIARDTAARLEAYWREQTPGPLSTHWTDYSEAARLVAEYGCKVCHWRYPRRVIDVGGDLWCDHCVREVGREVPLDGFYQPAHIPGYVIQD